MGWTTDNTSRWYVYRMSIGSSTATSAPPHMKGWMARVHIGPYSFESQENIPDETPNNPRTRLWGLVGLNVQKLCWVELGSWRTLAISWLQHQMYTAEMVLISVGINVPLPWGWPCYTSGTRGRFPNKDIDLVSFSVYHLWKYKYFYNCILIFLISGHGTRYLNSRKAGDFFKLGILSRRITF